MMTTDSIRRNRPCPTCGLPKLSEYHAALGYQCEDCQDTLEREAEARREAQRPRLYDADGVLVTVPD